MPSSNNAIVCRNCGDQMTHQETVTTPGHGPTIEMFACDRENCGRKAGLIFEPEGGLNEEQSSWVEQEVARRGSFFPTDWMGNAGPRRS